MAGASLCTRSEALRTGTLYLEGVGVGPRRGIERAAANRGEPDDGTYYYQHWLSALERLVTVKGLSDFEAMLARKEAWADAYRHTPHGKPVELTSADEVSAQDRKNPQT